MSKHIAEDKRHATPSAEVIVGMDREYLLAFGGNLPSPYGAPRASIHQAILMLEAALATTLECAAFYQTSPVPRTDQPDFINTAARMRCDLAPSKVLEVCLGIEQEFGRERRDRWDARTLDIDVLAVDDLILPNREAWDALRSDGDPSAIYPEIMVPHPRLEQRLFVLAPLKDIAPDWRHPCLGLSTAELFENCKRLSDEDIILLD